jgi:cyclopropane-fatty-acyl-phospholipid synthase
MAWHTNIEQAWAELPGYDDRFRRMWRFYLLVSAGGFRSRYIDLWQVVLSRDGLDDSYRPPDIR